MIKNGYNTELGGSLDIKIIPKSVKEKISKNHIDVSGENNPFYGMTHSKETIEHIKSTNGYKNRKYKGEDSHFCKITKEIAKEIKDYFKYIAQDYVGEIQEIAEKYNTTYQTVAKIKYGHTWKDI